MRDPRSLELSIKYLGKQSTKVSFHISSWKEKYKDLEFENNDNVVKITLVYYT